MAKSIKTRRLTRQEAALRGVSYTSKHQVDASIPKGNVTRRTKIYTERHATQIKLGSTKERYSEDIKHRRRFYSPLTRIQQRNARNSRQIREYLPDIAPKDKKVALKHLASGYHSLTKDEKERFRNMFSKYVSDDVRQALGSAPRDIGRFSVAA